MAFSKLWLLRLDVLVCPLFHKCRVVAYGRQNLHRSVSNKHTVVVAVVVVAVDADGYRVVVDGDADVDVFDGDDDDVALTNLFVDKLAFADDLFLLAAISRV